MPVRSLSRSKSIKFMFYADPGFGKTPIAATSTGNVLFIRPPVDHVDSVSAADAPRCSEWIVDDWNEMDEAKEEVRLAPPKKYDWVWFDSISAFQDIGLDDIWIETVARNPRRKDFGLDKGEFGINMQRLGRWVRDMVSLSDQGMFNLGITAWPADPSYHSTMQTSEDAEKPDKLMPWVQGKNMSTKVCGYMNMIGFGDITPKGNRVIYFEETDRYIAKDAFGAFKHQGGKLFKPTMPQIEEAVASARRQNGSQAKARPGMKPKATIKKQTVKVRRK